MAWRALEEYYSPLTGGEQMSLVGKFFHMTQDDGQDPREYWSEYNDVIGSLEAALEQEIPKKLVIARLLELIVWGQSIQKSRKH